MAGTLHVVGTPIGNLADLSPRAREALGSADVIAAEDTRRTGRLLQAVGLPKKPLLSVFEANERARVDDVMRLLRDGSDVALVTDGGMPLVSDPGYRLVQAALAGGAPVVAVPGPSAALCALAASGLPTDRFLVQGFPPRKPGPRRRLLAELAALPHTLVFFEAPPRVRSLLADVVDVLGDREIAVARELTKRFEEVWRGPAAAFLAAGVEPRGEVTIVVAGRARKEARDRSGLGVRSGPRAEDRSAARDDAAAGAEATALGEAAAGAEAAARNEAAALDEAVARNEAAGEEPANAAAARERARARRRKPPGRRRTRSA